MILIYSHSLKTFDDTNYDIDGVATSCLTLSSRLAPIQVTTTSNQQTTCITSDHALTQSQSTANL